MSSLPSSSGPGPMATSPATSAAASPAASAATSPAAAHEAAERVRARLMLGSLSALLDRVGGARGVLPFLAALERDLAVHGASAVGRIPAQHLQRIFGQLRALPAAPEDEAFNDLLRRVNRELRRHASMQTHQLAPFDPEATVVITEGSHSDFMDAMAAQQALPPR